MAKITYVEADGRAKTIDVPAGWSLMMGATANGVTGIVGECGGSCACGTCHCYVDEARLSELPPQEAGELEMLNLVAAERQARTAGSPARSRQLPRSTASSFICRRRRG